MKPIRYFVSIITLSFFASSSQAQHSLQIDDGAGHVSTINAQNPGGPPSSSSYILPAGGGSLLVSSGGASPAWLTLGNSGTTALNWLGTIDAQPLIFKTTATEAARFLSNGNLALGSPVAGSRLQISESGGQDGLYAIITGAGRAGFFEINNASNFSAALEVKSNGSGFSGSVARFTLTNAVGFALEDVVIDASANNFSGGLHVNGGGGGGWFLPGFPYGVFGQSGTGEGIEGSSNSGIGTYGGASTGTGVYAQVRGTGNALIVEADGQGASTTIANNLAIFKTNTNPGVGNVARIDNTGKGYFNGGVVGAGADVAEAFSVEGNRSDYKPGDVLVISSSNDRTVEKCSSSHSTRVAGVYATKPGVLLSSRGIDESLDDLVPMGVVGVIPTKVCSENGPIHRGDLLATSKTPGHAMKAKPITVGGVTFYPSGVILGKALENFDAKGTGIIEVMVNVK